MGLNLEMGVVLMPQDNGLVLTEDQVIIGEILKDIDPYLKIYAIPPDRRVADEKPFVVTHEAPGREPYYVGYYDRCDHTLLANVLQADNSKNPVLDELDRRNDAIKLISYKKHLDQSAEMADFVAAGARSPKHNWSFHNPHDNKLITVRG